MIGQRSPAVVIAAGGDGQRIGGGKPYRRLAGISLLDRALFWANRRSDCVAVAQRKDMPRRDPDVRILHDDVDGLGPMSALVSAFAFAVEQQRSHVLLIGCDMPFLPDDLPKLLQSRIGDAGAAVPVTGGHWHPMAALWKVDLPAIASWVAAGGRAPRRFAEHVGMVVVDWPACGAAYAVDPFFNVNTPEDLAMAEGLIKSEGH